MANDANGDAAWTERERPACLSKRFTFASYAENRAFLDRVAALSEETGIHPDIGFGRDYANLTVNAMEGAALSEAERDFARRVDACVDASG
jgi:pterin-4a-carbinolamine dehydratase